MIKRCSITLISIAILIGVISISPVSAAGTYVIDFEGLAEGTIVSTLSCGSGISCSGNPDVTVLVNGRNQAFPSSNTAMIFDAECLPRGIPADCSGDDDDLFLRGHGNIMINSEDRDSSDPDDQDQDSSFLEFDFAGFIGNVTIDSIDVADVEEDESQDAFINFHGGNCSQRFEIETIFDIPTIGDNEIRPIPIGASAGIRDAQCVQVRLNGSGAIDNIKFTIGDPPGNPGIVIEKLTNGPDGVKRDADDPNGDPDEGFAVPQIVPGQTVTWTYQVTNTGAVDFPEADVKVEDDIVGPVTTIVEKINGNNNDVLEPSETWIYQASGVALDLSSDPTGVTIVDGCRTTPPSPAYQNMGVVTATAGGTTVTDDDPSHYCNPPGPAIDIEKTTNGQDADGANDAPKINPGDQVTWEYTVTNPGNVSLDPVVIDDNGTPGDTSDDFTPISLVPNPGDTSPQNDLLDPGETWTYTASAIALNLATADVPTVDGCGTTPAQPTYENMAVVTATVAGTTVTDTDPSHYCNPPGPVIDIEKYTKIVATPAGGDLCETLGKPKMFTWRYTGDNVLDHSQKKDSVKGKGQLNGESPVQIEAEEFEGTIEIGEDFESKKGKIKIKDPSDPKGKKLLKEIEIHTSCSQPLVLGDKYGGVQLVGFLSKEGKKATFDPNSNTSSNATDIGEDADDPMGPEGQQGDTVRWTYVVTNPGTVTLSNVVVTDDHQGVTPVYQSGDTNNNNQLETTETWIYRAEGTVGSGQYNNGQYKNIGEACGNGAGQNVCDDDPSHHFFEAPPVDVCETLGKPQRLTMRYIGGAEEKHSQDPGKVNVDGDPGITSPVHIISSDKSDGSGDIYLAEDVTLGSEFDINATMAGEDKLTSNTFVLVFDMNGNLLQTIEFHTSCSQPLLIGDQFGSVQLISLSDKDGNSA